MTDSTPTRARGLGQVRTTITDTQEAAGKGEPGRAGWTGKPCPSIVPVLTTSSTSVEGVKEPTAESCGVIWTHKVNTNFHMDRVIRFKALLGIIERVLFITTLAFLCQ